MKKIVYLSLGFVIFGGALTLSEVDIISEARAECGSIWSTCSETEVTTLESELESSSSDDE